MKTLNETATKVEVEMDGGETMEIALLRGSFDKWYACVPVLRDEWSGPFATRADAIRATVGVFSMAQGC